MLIMQLSVLEKPINHGLNCLATQEPGLSLLLLLFFFSFFFMLSFCAISIEGQFGLVAFIYHNYILIEVKICKKKKLKPL